MRAPGFRTVKLVIATTPSAALSASFTFASGVLAFATSSRADTQVFDSHAVVFSVEAELAATTVPLPVALPPTRAAGGCGAVMAAHLRRQRQHARRGASSDCKGQRTRAGQP